MIVVGDSIIDQAGQITGGAGFYIDVTDTLEGTVADTVDHIAADITDLFSPRRMAPADGPDRQRIVGYSTDTGHLAT